MQQIIKTSSWETAKQINKSQIKMDFDNSGMKQSIIGSKNKIGDPNITQLHANVITPNVYSALCNIENVMIPVGGILMTIGNDDPSGIGATERLTITLKKDFIQNKGNILLYSQPIEFEVGEPVQIVSQKIVDRLQQLIEDETGIDKIYRPLGSQNTIDVTYIDRNKHRPVNIDDDILGLEIKGEVIVNHQSGYGSWDKIGVNNTLVDGIELSIWRRIA